MKILLTQTAYNNLVDIKNYIALDKPETAINFIEQLKIEINKLKTFPYSNRKSFYYKSKNVRDLIFRGYTIVYRVKENTIEILRIFNKNKS